MRFIATSLALITLNVSLSAHALPGWSFEKLKGWVEKHHFLTPRLSAGVENSYYAKRNIKGGFVVISRLLISLNCENGLSIASERNLHRVFQWPAYRSRRYLLRLKCHANGRFPLCE